MVSICSNYFKNKAAAVANYVTPCVESLRSKVTAVSRYFFTREQMRQIALNGAIYGASEAMGYLLATHDISRAYENSGFLVSCVKAAGLVLVSGFAAIVTQKRTQTALIGATMGALTAAPQAIISTKLLMAISGVFTAFCVVSKDLGQTVGLWQVRKFALYVGGNHIAFTMITVTFLNVAQEIYEAINRKNERFWAHIFVSPPNARIRSPYLDLRVAFPHASRQRMEELLVQTSPVDRPTQFCCSLFELPAIHDRMKNANQWTKELVPFLQTLGMPLELAKLIRSYCPDPVNRHALLIVPK